MEYMIREATQADYPGLCELFAEADMHHSQAVPHVWRSANGPARSPEFIADILARQNSKLFVAGR